MAVSGAGIPVRQDDCGQRSRRTGGGGQDVRGPGLGLCSDQWCSEPWGFGQTRRTATVHDLLARTPAPRDRATPRVCPRTQHWPPGLCLMACCCPPSTSFSGFHLRQFFFSLFQLKLHEMQTEALVTLEGAQSGPRPSPWMLLVSPGR